jgi:hypothetical protein
MIQLKDVWPNRGSDAFSDLWKDTEARANCDRAAKDIESGADGPGYWASENVQVGEKRYVDFAKKPSGALVAETE